MDQAWMIRSSQRQMLLETLKHRIMNAEEKRELRIDYDLAKICLVFLEFGGTMLRTPPNVGFDSWELFHETLLPSIEKFARAVEERDAMISDLLEWLIGSVTRDPRATLVRKEIAEPQTIFRAETATTEV